ncbi:MAG: hypothetical protein RL318_2021 [Fibrobacterota bacterium]|jgi:cell division septal protein FtsQ
MKPSLTSVNRTAVRDPSVARRQGMNARKQADQRRDQRRTHLRKTGGWLSRFSRVWGLSFLLLACLVAGGFVLHHQALQKGWIALQTVRCVGMSLMTTKEICRKAGLWAGTPLTALSTKEIEARLLADPRVVSVEVRRVWPHSLKVTLVEEVPQVRDLRGRGYGASGRNLGIVSSTPALPVLEGNPVAGAELAKLMTGLERLRREDTALWKGLRSLRPVPDGMTARVDGIPVELLLPAESTAEALRRAAWLYTLMGDAAGRVSAMDLRHAPYAVLVPMGRTGT